MLNISNLNIQGILLTIQLLLKNNGILHSGFNLLCEVGTFGEWSYPPMSWPSPGAKKSLVKVGIIGGFRGQHAEQGSSRPVPKKMDSPLVFVCQIIQSWSTNIKGKKITGKGYILSKILETNFIYIKVQKQNKNKKNWVIQWNQHCTGRMLSMNLYSNELVTKI